MTYVRFFSEVVHQRRFTEKIRRAESSERSTPLDLDHVHFDNSYDQNRRLRAMIISVPNLTQEDTRFSTEPCFGGILGGWYIIEALYFPASLRSKYYVSVSSWWGMYDRSAYLFVASPPVLSYHSQKVVEGTELQEFFMAISPFYFVVLSMIYFLSTAQSGVIHRDSSDPRLSRNTAILMTLSRDEWNVI